MSIVTLWSCDKKTNGQSLSTVAIATKMAIERNLKILLVSTSVNDSTIKNCFWTNNQKNKIVGGNAGLEVETGIEGLMRLIYSNKLEPEIISDYSQAILKGRFEVLSGYTALADATSVQNVELYKEIYQNYCKILQIADKYYDIVLVDLDGRLNFEIKNVTRIVTSGKRAYDIAIRIKTSGFDENKIEAYLDLEDAIKALYKTNIKKYVIANYTALQPTRRKLQEFNKK